MTQAGEQHGNTVVMTKGYRLEKLEQLHRRENSAGSGNSQAFETGNTDT